MKSAQVRSSEQLRDIARMTGPFTTVCINASRSDAASRREIDRRWQARRRDLAEQGAPESTLAAMEPEVLAPGHLGGDMGRLVVAIDTDVVLVQTLPSRPVRDESVYGPAPHLLPALRPGSRSLAHIVVEVDRAGATIHTHDHNGHAERSEVNGDHDVLHQVPTGLSERRVQARVHDSWERNAGEVATALDRLVARVHPDVVVVAGDPYASAALSRSVGAATAGLIVRLEAGGRAPGSSRAALETEVKRVLDTRLSSRRAALLERFSGAEARQQEAVQGVSAVVDAVRRGQVEELLLRDDPGSTLALWSGPEPGQLGITASEVAALGVAEPVRTRADAALIRGVLAADGGVTLLADDDPVPVEGIGALLRWSDRSTPHDSAPSMPGRGSRPGPPR